MDTFVVLQQMLILLAMMAIGYYSYRKEWIDRNAYGKLSKIVVNILNPLIIINGVLGRSGGENGEKVFINLLLILLYFIILIAVSFLVVRLLRVKPSQNHLYRMMTVFQCGIYGNSSCFQCLWRGMCFLCIFLYPDL